MGIKVLADKKHKFTVLTTKPADPANPTVAELEAGIEACMKIASDGFQHSAADSTTVDFKPVCGSVQKVFTDENFTQAMTVVRYYLAEGGIDPADDELFEAVKVRGTTLWGYGRLTDKAALDPWEAGDEFYLGTEFTTDHPQIPDNPSWVMFRIPCSVQEGWPFGTVAAGV